MTREEAIALFEKQLTAAQVVLDSGFGSNPGENNSLYRRRKEMAEIALSTLRPVSREQVEKVFGGKWEEETYTTVSGRGRVIHSKKCTCSACGKANGRTKTNFCPSCGVPMTDEAVEMVMERMDELQNEIG